MKKPLQICSCTHSLSTGLRAQEGQRSHPAGQLNKHGGQEAPEHQRGVVGGWDGQTDGVVSVILASEWERVMPA